MCGIGGIFFKKSTDIKLLEKFESLVSQKQHKRGPDEFNRFDVTKKIFFFHNMLSIIDVGNARQPMEDTNGVITYNGEVYNYKDLKYSDETYVKKSDTEVLLKGLHKEYINFLHKTNSMFGFGYYNKASQLLTLCRDRVGIKPVYFIETDQVFAFASTITPLVIFSQKRLNHSKLWQYYLNRAFKAPATIFDDIMELTPGSYLEFDTKTQKSSEIKVWWQRDAITSTHTDENKTIDEIEALLIDAIRNRLVADVPVGLFLSGGVDSSLIAALTSKQTSNLNAFTVGFHDKKYDESEYAKNICRQFNIGYNEIKVDADYFLNSIDNWITIQDDIVADPSALLLYKISEYAHDMNYRVLLAGEGSDELFAGYNSYKYFNWTNKIYKTVGRAVPFKSGVVSLFKNYSKHYNFLYNALNKPTFYGTAVIFEPHLMSELIKTYNNDDPKKAYDIKHALDIDIKDRLPNDLLNRSDRSTSGASLELRVPFLAHQLVNYSAGISEDLLMKDKVSKYLIKKLASRYINPEIIYRKKVGFDLPIRHWLSHELKDMMQNAINTSVQKDFIDIKVIQRCFDLHVNKNIDHADKLWAFLCLELSIRNLSSIS
jgi:asparagine synthase (glutamine-hydrolysing)